MELLLAQALRLRIPLFCGLLLWILATSWIDPQTSGGNLLLLFLCLVTAVGGGFLLRVTLGTTRALVMPFWKGIAAKFFRRL